MWPVPRAEGTGIDLDEHAAAVVAAPVRPPATLLAMDDSGAGNGDGEAGNYRVSGAPRCVPCSRSVMMAPAHRRCGAAQIASCAVHRSGALLLESRDGDNLDEYLQPIAGPAYTAHPSDPAAGADFDDVHDDDDSGGFGDDGGDYGGGPMEEDQECRVAEYGAPGADREAPAGHAAAAPAAAEDEFFDPYKPLDPNARGSLASKPFKRASRLGRKARGRAQGPPGDVLVDILTLQAPHPAGLLLPEFAFALASLHRDAAANPARRSSGGAAAQRAQQQAAQLASAFTLPDAAAAALAGADAADEAEEADADFFAGGFEDDGDDYGPAGDFGDAPPEFDGAADAWVAGEAGAAGAEAAAAAAQRDAGEMTYEELCRAHIEAFISAAAAAEVQTELASRVSTWRAKMAPALEEEDARPEFDIQRYGESLLGRMATLSCADTTAGGGEEAAAQQAPAKGAKGKAAAAAAAPAEMRFEEVMAQAEAPYDISRSFSSMLQLVNNGNVRLTKLGGSSDDFTLALLDARLPRRQIADYRAPGSAAAVAQGAAASTGAGEEPAAGVLAEAGNTPLARGRGKAASGKRRKA